MAVLRQFRCWAHDLEFESIDEKPAVPSGCSNRFVVLEFRTPPNIRSGGTRIADVMQKQLAQDYGLTNMMNDKDGSSVMSRTRTESGGTRIVGKEPARVSGSPGLFPVGQGWAQRGEPEPQFNARAAGLQDGGVPIKQIQD